MKKFFSILAATFWLSLFLLTLMPNNTLATQDPTQTTSEADALFQKKDWANAARAYQQLTVSDGQNVRAWYRLAYALQSSGQYPQAIAAYKQVLTLRPGANLHVIYNIACAYARLNDQEQAFYWLNKAVENGFTQIETLESDPDLVALKSDAKFSQLKQEMTRKAYPCKSKPQSRQFDFWIGEWEVKTPDGNFAGSNSVQLILGECVILENWSGAAGGKGKSINTFDQSKNRWQQTWVDDRGTVIEFVEGEYKEGIMSFKAQTPEANGTVRLRRLSFHNLGEDKVRQVSEASTDNGKTWTLEYDLYYFRKKT